MNLYELNALISSLHPVNDAELITFYKGKKRELINEINGNINRVINGLN